MSMAFESNLMSEHFECLIEIFEKALRESLSYLLPSLKLQICNIVLTFTLIFIDTVITLKIGSKEPSIHGQTTI